MAVTRTYAVQGNGGLNFLVVMDMVGANSYAHDVDVTNAGDQTAGSLVTGDIYVCYYRRSIVLGVRRLSIQSRRNNIRNDDKSADGVSRRSPIRPWLVAQAATSLLTSPATLSSARPLFERVNQFNGGNSLR